MGLSRRYCQYIDTGHVATIVGAAFMKPVCRQMHVGFINAAPTLHVFLLSQFIIELECLWIA